jgi:hypothetical protein
MSQAGRAAIHRTDLKRQLGSADATAGHETESRKTGDLMNDLDQAIRRSLSEEDADLLDRLGADQTLHRQVLATFEGQLRWWNAAGWLAGLVLFGVASLAALRFVEAHDVGNMLRWGGVSALAFAGIALIKIWFWLELQKNAIVREVKRLEVQVAGLAAQLRRR